MIALLILTCNISKAQTDPVPLGVDRGDEFTFTLNDYYYEHRNLGFEITKTYWDLNDVNISIGDAFQVQVLNETPSIISGLEFYVIGIQITNDNFSSIVSNHLSEFGFISHLDFDSIKNDISSLSVNIGLNETFTFTFFEEPDYFGYETLYQDEIHYRYGKAIYGRLNGVAINIVKDTILNSPDSEERVFLNVSGEVFGGQNIHSPVFKISMYYDSVLFALILGLKKKIQKKNSFVGKCD